MSVYLSVCLSVCPSVYPFVRMEKRFSTGRIFYEFDISVFFENMSRKFKFHENLTKITALYMKAHVHVWSYLAELFLD